jgi:hypothetical protein
VPGRECMITCRLSQWRYFLPWFAQDASAITLRLLDGKYAATLFPLPPPNHLPSPADLKHHGAMAAILIGLDG